MPDIDVTAREDLAFLRAIAEDHGGAPPEAMGAHIFSIGLPFGLNLAAIWAALTFDPAWLPEGWLQWSWVPGTLIYIPMLLWFLLRRPRAAQSPTGRIYGAAWAAVGLIALPIVLLLIVASVQTGESYWAIWPSLSFLLYGGAWAALAIIRRRAWHGLVAAGCIATAFAGAVLIREHTAWLVMGLGLILFMAAPGWAIMRQSRREAG